MNMPIASLMAKSASGHETLLRRCDYRPEDLIVFLGDLASKGPDNLSIVQMARKLGAKGVRGNHDFEVIR